MDAFPGDTPGDNPGDPEPSGAAALAATPFERAADLSVIGELEAELAALQADLVRIEADDAALDSGPGAPS